MVLNCDHCFNVARQTNADSWHDDSAPCDACCIPGGVTAREDDGAEFVPDGEACEACVDMQGESDRMAQECRP